MESEPQIAFIGRRRGGRPRSTVPHIRVSTWIPEYEFDRLARMAQEKDVSISTLVKDLLAKPRRFPS